MTTFRVGQRVRIKWSNGWPELAGQVGTVCGKALLTNWVGESSPDGTNVQVRPDVWGALRAPTASRYGGFYFSPKACQLEPLTDSNTLVSWESMRDLWVPEHLREAA